MSKAKQLIERLCPMPVIEPKPGTEKPGTRPGTDKPGKKERTNPFRRIKINPGEEPRPKAKTVKENQSSAASIINAITGKK